VLRVTPATEPMQIAVLVDNSAVIGPHVSNIRDGLKAFVGAMGAQHELSLVAYADRPTLLVNLTSNRAEVEAGIDRIFAQTSSGAYLMDAIIETSQGFIKRQSPRPVVVVVGTEGVEFSNAGYETVLDRLRESGAQLHVIQLVDDDTDQTQEERYRAIVIDRGTRDTGGRRDLLLSSMALPDAMRSVAAELTAQYRVVYSRPDSLIPPKDLKVSSANPDIEVRGVPTRAGER
jgi:hypothetical protein